MEATFFPNIMAFLWLGIMLMLGVFLRAKVRFFQRILFPASIIGGLIGFVLVNAGWLGAPSTQGWKVLDHTPFGVLTFHLFAFSFVGIGFLETARASDSSKVVLRGALWIALLFTMMFCLQALLGKGIFSGWVALFGGSFETVNGYLLGAGFTQGPGQTLAYASIWEKTYHVASAINTGLAFAAVGFLVAGLVGVPLALYGIRHGWVSCKEGSGLSKWLLCGLRDASDRPACAYSTTHPANIDSFGFHLGLMAGTYALAYLVGVVWTLYMPEKMKYFGFGMMFFWGMLIAMGIRKIMRWTGCIHLLDDATCHRLTNMLVDFMICSVFMGISLKSLEDIFLPFSLAVVLASALTLGLCLWFGRRCPEYGFERCLALFGYCTGTAASGLLLLRIVDPDFRTPVAVEIGVMNVCLLFIFDTTITLAMPHAPNPSFPLLWIFLGLAVVLPVIVYFLKMIRKPAF